MRSLFKDLSYGLRMWLKTPGLTLVAVLSLAVGIGVNSTVFGFVNTIMLKPLSVSNSDGLVYVFASSRDNSYTNVSYDRYLEFSKQNEVFSGLAAYSAPPMLLTDGGHTQDVSSEVVSVNYFSVFDIHLQRGQGFTAPEQSVSEPAVVISDNLWRRRFNADAEIIGKQLGVNGNSFSILGVAPPGFTGTDPAASTDLWMPIVQWANILKTINPGERDQKPQSNSPTAPTQSVDKGRLDPGHNWLQMIGRLKPGVTLPQAEAMMTTIGARLQDGSKVPQGVSKVTLSPVTAIHPALYEALPIGVAIVAVAGLILLICCVNVASLMLARAIVRRKEFAIRMALGGSRERIVRQLLTEALLLSIGGGALGLLFAYWTMRGVIRLLPPDVGFSSRIAIDWRVLLFSFVASLLTALIFGLLPALNTFRLDSVRSLAGDAMSLGGRRRINLRRVLVVIQIVASLVLLISTGLCLRSFQQGEAVTKNFKTDRMLLLNLNPTQYGYSIKYNKAFYRELLSRVVATPGVEAATLTNVLPLTMDRSMTFVRAEGGESMRVQQAVVADGYFKALDIPVLQGRPFEATDDDTTRQVVIVNEALARTLWPGQNTLGKTLRTGPDVSEVVGVVRSSAYNGFGKEAEPYLYVPLYQDLDNTVSLIVRTSGEPRAMMGVVQREIKALGGNLPIFDFKTLEDVLNGQLLPLKAGAALLGLLSLIGLVVASIGIYGVTSYSFSQRTKEIGVRMALGADRKEILRLIMKEGISLAVVGIVIGVLLSAATTHLASAFLFGVSPVDPIVFLGVATLLTLVAVGATLVPAMLAAKLNPVDALRHE